MPNTVVRYRTKPEHADENQRLIEKVFAELEELQVIGFSYSASGSRTECRSCTSPSRTRRPGRCRSPTCPRSRPSSQESPTAATSRRSRWAPPSSAPTAWPARAAGRSGPPTAAVDLGGRKVSEYHVLLEGQDGTVRPWPRPICVRMVPRCRRARRPFDAYRRSTRRRHFDASLAGLTEGNAGRPLSTAPTTSVDCSRCSSHSDPATGSTSPTSKATPTRCSKERAPSWGACWRAWPRTASRCAGSSGARRGSSTRSTTCS